jgi:hypothetical protein
MPDPDVEAIEVDDEGWANLSSQLHKLAKIFIKSSKKV